MSLDIVDREYRSVPHEGKLYSRLTMSTSIRNAILERNQELQRNDAMRDLSFGRLALAIPELDHYHLMRKYPDMRSTDKHTRETALAKFMASSESAPYKVRA